MNLLFRLLRIVIASWFAGRGANPATRILQPMRLTMRCWPTDLDPNIHMNNGRYLSIMDLGRIDLMMRAGLLPAILKRGWMPVIAASTMRYRRAIRPFEKFVLETRLIGWDERWVFLEQRFLGTDGRVKAIGLVQAAITTRAGRLPTAEIMQLAGIGAEQAPPLNDYVKDWLAMLTDWPVDEAA
jgi:acyl-CoA thioesterase FadM